MGNTYTKQAVQPPQRPKFRSLKTLAKSVKFLPYLVDGDLDGIDATNEQEVAKALADDKNFFVLVAPLKYKAYLTYENTYGEGLATVANRILYCLAASYQILRSDDEDSITLEQDELGAVITPYGKMYGTLERNMVDLALYIMTQHGRIVGVQDDGTYLCKHVTREEIIDLLDPRAILKIDKENDSIYTSLFMEILEISGVWMPDEIQNQLEKEGEEVEDDGLKNLVEQNNES